MEYVLKTDWQEPYQRKLLFREGDVFVKVGVSMSGSGHCIAVQRVSDKVHTDIPFDNFSELFSKKN